LKKEELSDLTDVLFVRLEQVRNLYKSGQMTKNDAQVEMIEIIQSINYRNSERSFWIQTDEEIPRMVYYSEDLSLNGHLLGAQDYEVVIDTNENLFFAAKRISNASTDGFIDYVWPSDENTVNKYAYVRSLEEFGWVFGMSFEQDEINDSIDSLIDSSIDALTNINTESSSREGYFFIFDSNYDVMVHPLLQGMNISHLLNPLTDKSIADELIAVSDIEGGYLEYLWDRPTDPGNYIYPKTAVVTYFEPFDWYIASTYYTEELGSQLNQVVTEILSASLFIVLISGLLTYWIGSTLTAPLSKLVDKIKSFDYDNLPDQLETVGTSEIATLTDSMNQMISSIKASQRELLDSHTQIKSIMDSATKIAIISTDTEGYITSFNVGAENMLGYRADDILYKKTPMLFHSIDEVKDRSEELTAIYGRKIDGFDTFTTVPNDEGYEEREWSYITSEHKILTVNLIVTCMYDSQGKAFGYLGLASNISVRKEMEEKLRKRTEELGSAIKNLLVHEEHLEDMVRERTIKLEESLATIQSTQNQLIESEKMALLGSLVAGVAHEINTPVGIGVTLSSSLEDRTKKLKKLLEDKKLTKKHIDEYIELALEVSGMMYRTMTQAGDLIQSFKLVAVDQSVENRRVFNLNEYVGDIINSLGSKFSRANVDIHVESDKEIMIDSYPGSFYQVFTNLMMNSLRHGFDGIEPGQITIKLDENEDMIVIDFSDNGCGISEENMKKIFEPFYTTKRSEGGTGLGLNIVNNLIYQKLKGTIKCDSQEGKGTHFEIQIPKEFI
jgi:PAS domain S-box-containing protein